LHAIPSMSDRSPADAGHRLVGHVADVILEAWGSTRVACLEEAVRGLVRSFADIDDVRPTDRVAVMVGAAGDEEVLVSLLEEVIYVVEVLGKVPVGVDLDEQADGGVRGFFETFPAERLEATGSVPKGVSRSDLEFRRRDRRWSCHALLDV
jgi:SHS2 domain-containing protein